jgi:hypothetical protein
VKHHEAPWGFPRHIECDNVPQEASPLDSVPPTDEGGVLGEVLDTDGLGDWFVFVRSRPGECIGVGALAAGGMNEFVVFTNGKGMDSGNCSDRKTSSKRARLK